MSGEKSKYDQLHDIDSNFKSFHIPMALMFPTWSRLYQVAKSLSTNNLLFTETSSFVF
jgi:hypothetical protein